MLLCSLSILCIRLHLPLPLSFFSTLCQIYSCSILERVMSDRIAPAVGSTISFGDDMCPIIRSSTQPQMLPSPPMSHHKQATAPILTGWSMIFPERPITRHIVSYILITEALYWSVCTASVSHISSSIQSEARNESVSCDVVISTALSGIHETCRLWLVHNMPVIPVLQLCCIIFPIKAI